MQGIFNFQLFFDLAKDGGHSKQEAAEIAREAVELIGADSNDFSGEELYSHLRRGLVNLARMVGHSRTEAEELAERKLAKPN